MSLSAIAPTQLHQWMLQAQLASQKGYLLDYVPVLGQADPLSFAAAVHCLDGMQYQVGRSDRPFTLMSVIKPFLLLFLLEEVGSDRVFQCVGSEASSLPFNALPLAKPANPMLNQGAIALAGMLPGKSGTECCQCLTDWLHQLSGVRLRLDTQVLASVRSQAQRRNREIAGALSALGFVEDAAIALDTYEQICCLAATAGDLARLGLLLAGDRPSLTRLHRQTVNAVLMSCGLYEASGKFALQVGLPSKSGVSGAFLSIVPRQGAIACYSPLVDRAGNSLAAVHFIQQMAVSLNLSLF